MLALDSLSRKRRTASTSAHVKVRSTLWADAFVGPLYACDILHRDYDIDVRLVTKQSVDPKESSKDD